MLMGNYTKYAKWEESQVLNIYSYIHNIRAKQKELDQYMREPWKQIIVT